MPTPIYAFTGTGAVVKQNSPTIQNLTLTGSPGILKPNVDSATALEITKADGSTAVITVDTTNSRVGVGVAPGTATLRVKAAASGSAAKLLLEDGTNQMGFFTLNSSGAGPGLQWGGVSSGDIGIYTNNNEFAIAITGTTNQVALGYAARAQTDATVLVADQHSSGAVTKLIVRGNASQSTNNLQEWQTSAKAVLAFIGATGSAMFGAAGANTAKLNVNADASGVGLIVRANATTPGDLLELQNNAGANLHQTDATGLTTLTGRDSATNTVFDALIVGHDTSNGTSIAQGFGTGIRLRAQSNNVADRDLARFRAYWDSTAGVDASRKSNATISVWNIGVETDVITFLPNQIQPLVGIRLQNNVSLQSANASGSSRALIAWNSSDVIVIGSNNGSGDNGQINFFAGNALIASMNSSTVTLQDAKNIAVGTTTGTKIGTATSQKFAFWNANPVVQPSTTGTTTGFTTGSGTTVHDDSTFTGGIGATAYRISDVVLALKQVGLLAA